MDIFIINQANGCTTRYKPCELIKDARHAVKGKGRLTDHWVEFREGSHARLVAQYRMADGWSSTVTVAI